MATTIHGGLGPFFKNASDEEKDNAGKALAKGFASLNDQMGEQPFLLGGAMSIADPYLFWTLLAASRFGIAVPERLRAFFNRMRQEPSVIQALAEEGLS
jgi:glutathione S-transferase